MIIMKTNKYVFGVTLVELMIALVISSILLIGVVTIYGSSKRTYMVGEEFAYLQENGRMAMKFIVEDVRMAGFMGCVVNDSSVDANTFQCYLNTADPTASNVCQNLATGVTGFDAAGTQANNVPSYPIAFSTAGDPSSPLVTGALGNWSYSGTPSLPASFPMTKPPVAGSDILFVSHGDNTGIRLNADKNDAANFSIDNQGVPVASVNGKNCHQATGLCAEDVLIASDCKKARVFQASDLVDNGGSVEIEHGASSPGNDSTKHNWGGAATDPNHFLQRDTEILKFHTYSYYVANNLNNQPTLFRHDGINAHAPQELVEGVENMQVLYGVDTSGNNVADYYASANEVDFTNTARPIVSVRVSLLVRSMAELPKRTRATNPFTLASTDVTNPQDGRIRKTFTTTIKIRNKGL